MNSRRMGLGALAAAGAVTALAAGSLLAVFTDEATSGSGGPAQREQVESPASLAEADLKLGRHDLGDPECVDLADDQASNYFDNVDLAYGSGQYASVDQICLVNGGVRTLTSITFTTFGLGQTEAGCTGSEPAVDPEGPDCGTEGELAQQLVVSLLPNTCSGSTGGSGVGIRLVDPALPGFEVYGRSAAVPGLDPGGLAPGEVACYALSVSRPLLAASVTPTDEAVAAQSDVVRWRFRFNAEAA